MRTKLILVIIVALSGPAYAALDVTSYGAAPDGGEGDAGANTTAIQNAVNDACSETGRTVHFPPGVYYIDNAISFHCNDVTLDGYGATLRRISTGPDPYAILVPGSGWVIQGLTIDGNRPTDVPAWSWGINIGYSRQNILIKDCTVMNVPFDGILISAEAGNVTVDNCTIIDNHRQGLSITDSIGGCVIKNSYFTGNDYQGLDIEPDGHHTGGHQVINCTFDNAGTALGGNLNLWGASYGPYDIYVEDCNFINNADFIGNRIVGHVQAVNNAFHDGGGFVFNSYNDASNGLGSIELTGNVIDGQTNDPVNLVANGGFEAWTGGTPDDWTVIGSGVGPGDPCTVLAGNSAAYFNSASLYLQQTIPATPGQYYTGHEGHIPECRIEHPDDAVPVPQAHRHIRKGHADC